MTLSRSFAIFIVCDIYVYISFNKIGNIMIHKISKLCDKIDTIKAMSDKLRDMKYNKPKADDSEIDNMIATIQADCLLVANDKQKYEKK